MFNVFRVGTKEGGTRFMTFVDSINGFKHLLTQQDLDKALSMCSSMKGKLRSRFIVLSDDRTPPPPPANNRGKRTLDDEPEDNANKRKFVPRSKSNLTKVPGVTPIAEKSSTQSSEAAGGSGLGRRTTPPRFAKRAALPGSAKTSGQQVSGQQASAQTDLAVMEVCSNGSGSTEDWASSKSNDDTLEDHV